MRRAHPQWHGGAAAWELVAHWAPGFNDFEGTTANGTLPYVHADWQAATAVVVGGGVRVPAGTDGGLFTTDNVWDAGFALPPGGLRNRTSTAVVSAGQVGIGKLEVR